MEPASKHKRQSLEKHKKTPKPIKLSDLTTEERFHVFITPDENQIWLSSLGLAWQQLEKKYGFKPEISEGSRAAPLTISGFTSNSCTQDDIDPECVYFRGGIKNNVVKRINEDLSYKFPEFNVQQVDPINPNQAILFGGLFKQLKLKYPLFQIPGKIMHFKGIKVPCFQPMQKEQRQQIYIVKYIGQDNFTLRINLLEKDSYMFVIRSKEKLDIKSVIAMVGSAKQELEPLSDEDVFKIPQLKIKVSQYLSEIIGIKGKIEGEENPVTIIDCFQTIHLEMKGQPHRQRMDTMVLSTGQDDGPSLHSRRMAVRGPFWLVLKRKDHHPYMIMYVNKYNEQSQ